MQYTINKEQANFQMQVREVLEEKDAIKIMNISAGHIFDVLHNHVEHETYTAAQHGHDVTLELLDDPDGVSMVCQDYDFEFDLLSKPMSSYNYFRTKVIADNPELVKATAAMLETTYQMFQEHGVNLDDMGCEWDG